MSSSPSTKNILRMLETHFWKKVRMLSLDEKVIILTKKRVFEIFYNKSFKKGMSVAKLIGYLSFKDIHFGG